MQQAIKSTEESTEKLELFLKLKGAIDTIDLCTDSIESMARFIHLVNDSEPDEGIRVKLIESIKEMLPSLYHIMEWITRVELYTQGSISDFLSQKPRSPLPEIRIIKKEDAFYLPDVGGRNITVKRLAPDSLERDTYKMAEKLIAKLEGLKKISFG